MTFAPHQIELIKSLKATDFVPTTLEHEWDHTDDMILHIIHDHGFIVAAGITHSDHSNEFLDQVVDDSTFFDSYQFDPEGVSDEACDDAYCLGNANEFFDLEGLEWVTIPFPAITLQEFVSLIHTRYINANQETEAGSSGPITQTL